MSQAYLGVGKWSKTSLMKTKRFQRTMEMISSPSLKFSSLVLWRSGLMFNRSLPSYSLAHLGRVKISTWLRNKIFKNTMKTVTESRADTCKSLVIMFHIHNIVHLTWNYYAVWNTMGIWARRVNWWFQCWYGCTLSFPLDGGDKSTSRYGYKLIFMSHSCFSNNIVECIRKKNNHTVQ